MLSVETVQEKLVELTVPGEPVKDCQFYVGLKVTDDAQLLIMTALVLAGNGQQISLHQ